MSSDSQVLTGKVAIVTGGAGGSASPRWRALAAARGRTWCWPTCRGTPLVQALAAGLAAKRACPWWATRWTSPSEDSVRRAGPDFAVDTFGGIDVLVNNAALTAGDTGPTGTSCTMPVELWDRVLAVNLRGPMLLCKNTAVPVHDRARRRLGHQHGQRAGACRATATMVAYGSSKGGLDRADPLRGRRLRRRTGVRCNAVAPGLIRTPVAGGRHARSRCRQMFIRARTCCRGSATPDDVAASLVTFLASPAAGVHHRAGRLPVDGGFLAHLPSMAVPSARRFRRPGAEHGVSQLRT